MSTIIRLFLLSCLLVVSITSLVVANEEEKLKVVVNPEVSEPKVDLTIDEDHIEATYYDKEVTGELYTKERREFDGRMVDALMKFCHDFATDVVVNNKMSITLSLYVGTLTRFVAKWMPEFSRAVKASGTPVKDNFIGDALTIWKVTMEHSTKPEAISAMPKDGADFMKKLDHFLDEMSATVHNNPAGIYLDWKHLTINQKSMGEHTAPFLAYLKKRGYGTSITILNAMMKLLSKIKPGSDEQIPAEGA